MKTLDSYEWKMVGESKGNSVEVIKDCDNLDKFDRIFYSVYARYGQEVACIVDFSTKSAAEAVTNELNDLLKNLKSFRIR